MCCDGCAGVVVDCVVTCCVVTCVGLLFGLGFVDLCIVGVD